MPEDRAYDEVLGSAMAELAAGFAARTVPVEEILASVTSAAVALIEGVDFADILIMNDDGFTSVSPTAQVAADLDDVQRRFQEGPCLEAAVGDIVVRCTDLRTDSRWPRFAAAAVAHGVHSVLSFQLYTHRGGAGALNLLARMPRAFSAEAEALGAMLATHAAIALSVVNKEQQFESALASRDAIGQAKGILMERFGIDAVGAFELLKKLSQDSNTPIRVIAERLISSLHEGPSRSSGSERTTGSRRDR